MGGTKWQRFCDAVQLSHGSPIRTPLEAARSAASECSKQERERDGVRDTHVPPMNSPHATLRLSVFAAYSVGEWSSVVDDPLGTPEDDPAKLTERPAERPTVGRLGGGRAS
jgi:hypothetical protein